MGLRFRATFVISARLLKNLQELEKTLPNNKTIHVPWAQTALVTIYSQQ